MAGPDDTVSKRGLLVDLVARFPESPGVYLMKDAAGEPIYIGKAVNLRSRVRSYFSDGHEERPQIPVMLSRLETIEWIATTTEAEALILEANLIRKHTPRYNIDLRDDKHFPYLKVTVNEPFPRLLIVRRVDRDGSRYFGPYTDATSMRRLAVFARRIFRLCDCTAILRSPGKKARPCINYSMGRCAGACAGKITREEYAGRVRDLVDFLAGRRNRLLAGLEARMENASAALRFEEAARLRDQIRLIRQASRLQQADLRLPDVNCDVFGLAEGERHVCLSALLFREGLLVGGSRFVIDRGAWDLAAADRDGIVLQFYLDENRTPPPEVLLPAGTGINREALQRGFETLPGRHRCAVIVPDKGIKRRLVAMAEKNARPHLLQKAPVSGIADCADLQKALSLPRLPETIEAFDISNLGETNAVAGMARFKDGRPDKSGYRRYKIKSVSGQNDFAMLLEAVSRRLERLSNEKKPFPDLLLIDGGKGQLHAAQQALARHASPPAVIALAKKEELIFSPALTGPVRLPATHPARRLLERVRDEAHRFAVSYHRKLRGKQFSRSSLENIPGIGPAKAKLLLTAFGSLEGVKRATAEEIAKVNGITYNNAVSIKNAFGNHRPRHPGGD